MPVSSAITPNLLFNAAGFAMSQKAVAVYLDNKGLGSKNFFESLTGLNVSQMLFGAFGEFEEVLAGGTELGTAGIPIVSETSILNLRVSTSSRLAKHPVETGAQIADHKIFEPARIDMQMAFPALLYDSVFKQLQKLYRESTWLAVLAKNRVYHNMIITDIPHDESPRRINRLIFNITFQEVLRAEGTGLSARDVANPEDADFAAVGTVNVY